LRATGYPSNRIKNSRLAACCTSDRRSRGGETDASRSRSIVGKILETGPPRFLIIATRLLIPRKAFPVFSSPERLPETP
jgi:hypothetical protein